MGRIGAYSSNEFISNYMYFKWQHFVSCILYIASCGHESYFFFNSRASFSRKNPSLGKGIILLKYHLNLKKRWPEYACAI